MQESAASYASKVTIESIKRAILTQARVINALVLRETKTRYGDHKIGFVWAILEPLIMVTIFVVLFSTMRSKDPGGMPLILFMITGIVPFTLFKGPMAQMQGAIAQNRSLFAFPQVTTFDVIIARGILEVMVISFVFAFLLLMADIAGFSVSIERPLEVLAAITLLAMMGLGLGFAFASISPIIPSMKQISSALLGRPLFVTSGLFFTADSIPPPFREYLLYNPILHVLECLRSAFFFEFESSYGDWNYAMAWAFGLLSGGLLLHQALRRRAIIGL